MTERGRAPREIDSAERAQRLHALVYSLAGGIVGAAAGVYAGTRQGGLVAVVLGLVLGLGLGFSVAYVAARLIVESAGRFAELLYNPSGRSTPTRPEYSYAASLAARGRIEDAIAAYELSALENPHDPEPCFRIARLYRDALGRYEEAIAWFRRAREAAGAEAGPQVLATREILEVCTSKLDDPLRAAPDLARLADRFGGTPAGEWARSELLEIKGWGRSPKSPTA